MLKLYLHTVLAMHSMNFSGVYLLWIKCRRQCFENDNYSAVWSWACGWTMDVLMEECRFHNIELLFSVQYRRHHHHVGARDQQTYHHRHTRRQRDDISIHHLFIITLWRGNVVGFFSIRCWLNKFAEATI